MSYMEYPIILFQQYILIGTVLFYNNRLNVKVLTLSVLYIGLFTAFVCELLPSSILTILVVCFFFVFKLYYNYITLTSIVQND